jgi:hypothetical protein
MEDHALGDSCLHFLLALSEVNVYLALRFFKWACRAEMTLLQFCRHLSGFMIHNPWLPINYEVVVQEDITQDVACDVILAPNHAKEYRNHRWVCTAKAANQQYVCKAYMGARNRSELVVHVIWVIGSAQHILFSTL